MGEVEAIAAADGVAAANKVAIDLQKKVAVKAAAVQKVDEIHVVVGQMEDVDKILRDRMRICSSIGNSFLEFLSVFAEELSCVLPKIFRARG